MSVCGRLITSTLGIPVSIASAINNRQLLSFSYDGYPRIVEPHTYGTDTKSHTALRAYQVRGGSESGEYVGWKSIVILKSLLTRQSTRTPIGAVHF